MHRVLKSHFVQLVTRRTLAVGTGQGPRTCTPARLQPVLVKDVVDKKSSP